VAGLTVAAACAGFEMGIQPILNSSATGVPLYMPYGLNVTVPAMVFGHAFFFSIIEAVVTAAAFAYIARNDPSIHMELQSNRISIKTKGYRGTSLTRMKVMEKVLRNLLIWLLILVILVPLGIIASGTAYGEWSVDELQSLIVTSRGFRQSERFVPCSDTGLRHRLGQFLHWPELGILPSGNHRGKSPRRIIFPDRKRVNKRQGRQGRHGGTENQ